MHYPGLSCTPSSTHIKPLPSKSCFPQSLMSPSITFQQHNLQPLFTKTDNPGQMLSLTGTTHPVLHYTLQCHKSSVMQSGMNEYILTKDVSLEIKNLTPETYIHTLLCSKIITLSIYNTLDTQKGKYNPGKIRVSLMRNICTLREHNASLIHQPLLKVYPSKPPHKHPIILINSWLHLLCSSY